MNRYEKLLLVGGNIWYLGEGMLGPLFAVFAERIGGDVLSISWAWAAYLIAAGLFTVVVGWISDRSGLGRVHEKLMVLGYALNAAFTFGYLLVDSPASLLVVQLGLGISSALATPTWNALYSRHADRKREGSLWGLAVGQSQLVTGAAILLGGFIVNTFSFNALFFAMGCIQVLATVYQAQILRA